MKKGEQLNALLKDKMVLSIQKQRETKELDGNDFFKKLYEDWLNQLDNNTIYKRTPKKFKSNTNFFILLYDAFVFIVGDTDIDVFCKWMYNVYVYLYISPCLDVDLCINTKMLLKNRSK